MKASLIGALLIIVSTCVFGDTKWTYMIEEGEDATSTHYYYFYSNAGKVEKVRWFTNGGAQNMPTVTEFELSPSSIRITKGIGERSDIASLVAGRDAKLKIVSDSTISCKYGEWLTTSQPEKSLTMEQRLQVCTLIDLLARDKKPIIDQQNKAPNP